MVMFVLSYIFRCVTEILMYFEKWPDIFYSIDLNVTEALLYVL